ncbi:hypothethical protein [Ralstonia solanacearum PSI07]|nr:hypothethical protein [Ralstonia solanacearum PSI07]
MLHYEAQAAPGNEVLKARLVELAHERRRFGYRRLHAPCWSARVCTRITNAYIGFIARRAWLSGVGGDATA